MNTTQLIHIVAGAASLGFSVALANAIAAHPTAIDGPARRRIGCTMLGFLVTVGLSLTVGSMWPGS